VKLTTAKVKNARSYTSTPPYVFTARCLVQYVQAKLENLPTYVTESYTKCYASSHGEKIIRKRTRDLKWHIRVRVLNNDKYLSKWRHKGSPILSGMSVLLKYISSIISVTVENGHGPNTNILIQ